MTSNDGTEITWFSAGSGPPLLLVHGSACDHTRWGPLMARLEPHRSVHAVDRRGRGASGDHRRWQLEREFEDVAAVVDAIAESSGEPVAVYGHSFGASCVLGASRLTPNMRAMALYEPPINPPVEELPGDPSKRIASALRIGDREGALVTFLTQVAGVPAEACEAMRGQPSWPARVETAPTLAREFHGIPDWEFVASDFAEVVTPTLVVAGEHSPSWLRADAHAAAAALPNSRAVEFHGQSDAGDLALPERFAQLLLGFVAA